MKRPATRPSAGWPKAIPGRVYAITSQGHVQSGTRHDAGQFVNYSNDLDLMRIPADAYGHGQRSESPEGP
eukprot:s2479_g4.t2